jgi:hypothetical protein
MTMLAAACDGRGSASQPPAPAPAVALEHISTIGCADCDDERQVTPVALAVLDDQRIAVLDGFEPFVRVFGIDGALRQSYGSKGQGPGELGMALPPAGYLPGMWLFGNDLGGVTVLDIMPFSLEAFDAEGNFVDSTDTGMAMAVPTAQAFDPQTQTYYRIAFTMGPGGGSRRITRCRFPAVGEAGCETFADPDLFLQGEGMPGDSLGSLVLAATPEGSLVVGNAGSYEIWVVNEQGEIIARGGRDLPLPRKSAAEIQAERQRFADAGLPEREIDPNRWHIADYGLQVDGDGRIWVLTGRYGDDDSVFDVFAADGTFIGEVAIDAAVRRTNNLIALFIARGDLLAAAAQRPDGNQEIRLYRIRASDADR